jgi:hypothetical protein
MYDVGNTEQSRVRGSLLSFALFNKTPLQSEKYKKEEKTLERSIVSRCSKIRKIMTASEVNRSEASTESLPGLVRGLMSRKEYDGGV